MVDNEKLPITTFSTSSMNPLTAIDLQNIIEKIGKPPKKQAMVLMPNILGGMTMYNVNMSEAQSLVNDAYDFFNMRSRRIISFIYRWWDRLMFRLVVYLIRKYFKDGLTEGEVNTWKWTRAMEEAMRGEKK